MKNLVKVETTRRKDYTTINKDGVETSHGTYAMAEIKVDDSKDLLFNLHVRTVFYSGDKVIDSIYTKDYPENYILNVPKGTTSIKTIYHREEKDIFTVQEVDKVSLLNNSDIIVKNNPIIIDENAVIYVDNYGFKNDGVTDNSDALLKIEDIINNNGRKNHNYSIVFGPGVYLFSKNHLDFLKHKENNCVWGLHIKGQGAGVTSIIYNPKNETEEHCFIYNSNNYGSLRFSDFTFGCKDTKNVTFVKQIADPYSQSLIVDRVTYNNVNYTFNLKGSDCNSEFSINDCKWRGKCDSVLNATKPGLSAQFLNYWFKNPDFQCWSGSFINMEMGGSISIKNGNFIHKSTDGSHIVEGGTFFKLGLNTNGDNQQLGICRFSCEGARFECSVARKSNIIESNWGNNGSISFISCDDTAMTNSGAGNDDYKKLEECKFICTRGIPAIKFQNCMLHGLHTYDLSNNVWGSAIVMNSIEYDNCLLGGNLNTPYDFINIINPKNENAVLPNIKFTNLNKKFGAYEGSLYKGNNIQGSILNEKYLNIKTPRGIFPIKKDKDSCKTLLPKGSLVTGVILFAAPWYSDANNINNIEIYLGSGDNKETLLKINSGVEHDGLNYRKKFDKPIFINNEDDLRTITFTRDSTIPGYGKEDKLIALVEFI